MKTAALLPLLLAPAGLAASLFDQRDDADEGIVHLTPGVVDENNILCDPRLTTTAAPTLARRDAPKRKNCQTGAYFTSFCSSFLSISPYAATKTVTLPGAVSTAEAELVTVTVTTTLGVEPITTAKVDTIIETSTRTVTIPGETVVTSLTTVLETKTVTADAITTIAPVRRSQFQPLPRGGGGGGGSDADGDAALSASCLAVVTPLTKTVTAVGTSSLVPADPSTRFETQTRSAEPSIVTETFSSTSTDVVDELTTVVATQTTPATTVVTVTETATPTATLSCLDMYPAFAYTSGSTSAQVSRIVPNTPLQDCCNLCRTTQNCALYVTAASSCYIYLGANASSATDTCPAGVIASTYRPGASSLFIGAGPCGTLTAA